MASLRSIASSILTYWGGGQGNHRVAEEFSRGPPRISPVSPSPTFLPHPLPPVTCSPLMKRSSTASALSAGVPSFSIKLTCPASSRGLSELSNDFTPLSPLGEVDVAVAEEAAKVEWEGPAEKMPWPIWSSAWTTSKKVGLPCQSGKSIRDRLQERLGRGLGGGLRGRRNRGRPRERLRQLFRAHIGQVKCDYSSVTIQVSRVKCHE